MNDEFAMGWDELPLIPQERSRLYALEPLGVGTSQVECLTSYIHRLADAHGVPAWVLVCRELAPRFSRKSMLAANGHCDLFGRVGLTINGNNHTAREAVSILEALTGHARIRSLTFCQLGGLVAEHRIVRGTQAWCPECLEQWHQAARPIYRPLVWLLSSLKTCPTHGCVLEERCPGCGQPHGSLLRYRWTGNCPRCSAWLGKASHFVEHTVATPQAEWETVTAAVLNQFVIAMQSLSDELPETTFPANVTHLLQTRFGGNASALARVLHIHHSTVSAWATGTARPSPASLASLAYCFGGEAMNWLTGTVASTQTPDTRRMQPAVAARVRRPLRRQPPAAVRARLVAAFPVVGQPPRSLTVICRELGVDTAVAKRLCPDLAATITARYWVHLGEGKRIRERYRRMAVESAVSRLIAEGHTVSFNQLDKVLPPKMSARDKLVRDEFKRLRAKSMSE